MCMCSLESGSDRAMLPAMFFLFLWDTIRSVIELMRQGQLEPALTRAHLQVQLAQALQELEKPWGRLGYMM